MDFCSYCECQDCKTGVLHLSDSNGNRVPTPTDIKLTHAPTEWGDWICDICYLFECCVDWQDVLGEAIDPCQDKNCGHRPKLVGPFVPITASRKTT